MRKVPELQLVFDTFEKLMEFVNNNKNKIKDYSWEKYNGEYWLSFLPTKEVLDWWNNEIKKRSVWDWKEEIKEMREKDKKNK